MEPCCPTKQVPLLTSSTADRTQSGRIHRLKCKSISGSGAATIGQFKAPSVRLLLKQGQTSLNTYDQLGIRVTDPGCCPATPCLPVCDLSGEIFWYDILVTNPYVDSTDLSGIEVNVAENVIGAPTIPPPVNTINYENDYAFVLYFPESCNATSYSVTLADSAGDPVEIDAHYLGLFPSFDDPAVKLGVFVIYVIPNFPSWGLNAAFDAPLDALLPQ